MHLDIIEAVVAELRANNYPGFIVIRSTIPPGTSAGLNVYFMPEFLTEKNFQQDFVNNKLWVFGLLGTARDEGFQKAVRTLIDACHAKGCIKNNAIEWMSTSEAEMVKYFRNTFLAVKISYCNEMSRFAEQGRGVDVDGGRNGADGNGGRRELGGDFAEAAVDVPLATDGLDMRAQPGNVHGRVDAVHELLVAVPFRPQNEAPGELR